MSNTLSKILCPFCFTRFDPKETVFRCVNPKCAKQPDTLYDDKRNLINSPDKNRVFRPPQQGWKSWVFITTSARCDECGETSHKRLCPHCHFELSHDAGMIRDQLIAVIGAKFAGKGHYFTTLIQRLRIEVGRDFDFSLGELGDETRSRFHNEYYEPLFLRKELLQSTQSASVDNRAKTGMTFRLTFSQQRNALNLTFFDSAGEDLENTEIMSRETLYINSANGIIFLLDPLQIDTVRDQLGASALPPRHAYAEPRHIVQRLRELVEKKQDLSATTKVSIPVAFVLTKVDALKPLLNPGSCLDRIGDHHGFYNLTDAQSVHTEIEAFLDQWSPGFTYWISHNFAHYQFFGVSALGQPPSQPGRVETVSPVRVEDPFLWLLHTMKLIKARKRA